MSGPDHIWFHIIVMAISVATIVLSALNVFYFNRVRNDPIDGVTANTALTMLILNAILIGLAAIVVMWCLVRLILGTESNIVKRVNQARWGQSPSLRS